MQKRNFALTLPPEGHCVSGHYPKAELQKGNFMKSRRNGGYSPQSGVVNAELHKDISHNSRIAKLCENIPFWAESRMQNFAMTYPQSVVVCLFCFFTSQVNSYGHGGTWASLNKQLNRRPISRKVWDRAGIELTTSGSAVRLASVARHLTNCSMRFGPEWSWVTSQRYFPQRCDCRRGTSGDIPFSAELHKSNFPMQLSPELWKQNFMKTFPSTVELRNFMKTFSSDRELRKRNFAMTLPQEQGCGSET